MRGTGASMHNRLHGISIKDDTRFRKILGKVYSMFGKRSWMAGKVKKRRRAQLSLEDAWGLPIKWPTKEKKPRAKRAKSSREWRVTTKVEERSGDNPCTPNGDEKSNGNCGSSKQIAGNGGLGDDGCSQILRENPACQETVSRMDTTPPSRSKYSKGEPGKSAIKGETFVRKEVRFSEGLLGEKYGTDDGHPIQDGRRPVQIVSSISFGSPSKTKLTWKKIKEVETLLEGTCEPSLIRLRRRAGLEPPRIPHLKYLTSPKKEILEGTSS